MGLTRRELLSLGAAAGGLATLPGIGRFAFAAAEPDDRDLLVAIFLRGGCDALSLVAPVNDPDYVADRAPELRVLDSGPKPGRPLRHSFAPAVDFRLHPEAAPLGDLYDAGQLAIVHAVGLENGTRSHFIAQDLMERGLSDAPALARVGDGWLTRLMADRPAAGPAIATTPALPVALAFHADSLAVPDLRGGLGLPGGAQTDAVLRALYAPGEDAFSRTAARTLADMAAIDTRLARGADGKVLPYAPEGNAIYEESEAGRALRTVAWLIRLEVGLKVACVDVGGWDHHEHMAGRFSGLAGQFARALAAFWADVARWHPRLTLVVMSEFGRRLRSNRSGGTDHGHGGVMMVLGGHVNGGAIYGRWPGLASHQLDNGVDLAVTTDYRAVLADVLTRRLGAASRLPSIFPGYTAGPGLGIVRT